MRLLRLSGNKFTKLDDSDYKKFSIRKFYVTSHGYARNRANYLHRLVSGAPDGSVVDHANGDKLDNRRSNLRVCHQRDNSRNQVKRKVASSRYKGVKIARRTGHWIASITVRRKGIYLGYFKDEKAAARAYDKAARRHFGKFASLNSV
jgi:hypothetical protein